MIRKQEITTFEFPENAIIWDVRDASAFTEAHLKGAVNQPITDLSADSLTQVSTDQPIYILCGGGSKAPRAAELLEQVGLSAADVNRYPHQFSGGQRQRISIARALALNPEFIVCDEPTSALDVSVQAQVLNLMKKLQKEMGLSYLFISHNLAVIHHMADRVGVMYLGRIVEIASRDELFTTPRHPYTKMLLGAIPDMTGSGRRRVQVAGEVPNPLNPPSGCTFHPRCPLANERCKQEVPQLTGFQGIQIACHAVIEGRD